MQGHTATPWTKERDELGFVHFLAVGVGGYSMKAEKSAAGDYFLTAYCDGDPSGGDVEYFDTLQQAKRRAESLIKSGEWVDLALDVDAARAALSKAGSAA